MFNQDLYPSQTFGRFGVPEHNHRDIQCAEVDLAVIREKILQIRS